jgi:hypothetical protein
MTVIIFSRREDAEAAQLAGDRAQGLPREHQEGVDYQIARPGRAAARLRERGIRTEHWLPIVAHPAGDRFAVGKDDAHELDETWRRNDPPPR